MYYLNNFTTNASKKKLFIIFVKVVGQDGNVVLPGHVVEALHNILNPLT